MPFTTAEQVHTAIDNTELAIHGAIQDGTIITVLAAMSVRATVGRAARTSGRARTSRGSEGLVYYEIIDYIINAPSRGSEEERMGIPCW